MEIKCFLRVLAGLFTVLLLFCGSCSDPEITETDLRNHIQYLSSAELAGRKTGEAGDSLAAEYIRARLVSYGLQPVSGNGFQHFRVAGKVSAGEAISFSLGEKDFTSGEDFTPPAFSSNGTVDAEAVSAGFGFSIKGDSLNWDDYAGIDVKGKWVLILRGDPEPDSIRSVFIPYSSDRDKAMLAKDQGAAGVLLVSGESLDPEDVFESINSQDFPVGIPVLRVKRKIADQILDQKGITIKELEKRLMKDRKPSSFSTGAKVKATAGINREENITRNVVMMLPGKDEKLKNEFVVIGAHFDHLGTGGKGSSSRTPDTVAVHPGADDNASGVALMLELAEKLSYFKGNHKRSILFIAFSGEELGLLGSKYFTENPLADLSRVDAMINLDMLGRLEEKTLQITGAGTAVGFRDIIEASADTNLLKLSISDEGYGPSDHSSFYGKNIPVLFFTTGPHLDYHTPGDSQDKINYTGMKDISGLVVNIVNKLVNDTARLQFRESGPKIEQGRVLRRRGVTLGIMPDFAGKIKNGLRADFVTPGKPAALGGMQKGDIITAINGQPVNNIQDYMYRMSKLKHGQTINVEVLRGEKRIVLLIQL